MIEAVQERTRGYPFRLLSNFYWKDEADVRIIEYGDKRQNVEYLRGTRDQLAGCTYTPSYDPETAVDLGIQDSIMLDSGAHSLFNIHARDTRDYSYYETQDFWDYVDNYAELVKKYSHMIDVYVNVDVIKNPKLTLKVQQYLESAHGLNPIPVIHHGPVGESDPLSYLKTLEMYADRYEYIGIGGVAAGANRDSFMQFANAIFRFICDKDGIPQRKLHGFAMTALDSIVRFPWFSVDSTAWVKTSRMGTLYVPEETPTGHNYAKVALRVTVSQESPKRFKEREHFQTLKDESKAKVLRYLESIGLTLEEVSTDYKKRDVANIRYFWNLYKQLPPWPWPYNPKGKYKEPMRM